MTLALIAGQGGLPPHLVRALRAAGETPMICEFRGTPSQVDAALPRLTFRLERLGSFLATLKDAGVTRVCMAGAMRRPEIDSEAIDDRTASLIPRLMAALAQGDDGTLRVFIALFEEQGFEVVSAVQVAPDLLPPEGVLTRAAPPDLTVDLAAARAALAEMGAADQGQAVIVRGGTVLGREDARGTDALIAGFCAPPDEGSPAEDPFFGAMDLVGGVLGSAADWLSGTDRRTPKGSGALLYKGPKPGQERRADLPTIGPDTAARAAEAGFAGLVIEAAGVIVLDRDAVVETLDRHGLFLAVVAP